MFIVDTTHPHFSPSYKMKMLVHIVSWTKLGYGYVSLSDAVSDIVYLILAVCNC